MINPLKIFFPSWFPRTLETSKKLIKKVEKKFPNYKIRNEYIPIRFLPTIEWQQVEEWHILPPGLAIRMNLSTGKNEAKLT